MNRIHKDGRDCGEIMLFALSTCGWCKKTKALLDELGVAYDYVDLDLEKEDKETLRAEVRKWNPSCSLPTLIIAGQDCIVGFQEEKIRKAVMP